MELLVVILVLISSIIIYFCAGIVISFLINWWILILGIPILILFSIKTGWTGSILAIVFFGILLYMNNQWHQNSVYYRIIDKINKFFNFND